MALFVLSIELNVTLTWQDADNTEKIRSCSDVSVWTKVVDKLTAIPPAMLLA